MSNDIITDNLGPNDFFLNDFVFPVEEKEDNLGLYEFPNFAIFYNIKDDNYYIKDFNTGVGALMKIKQIQMAQNTLINIGSNYLVVYINDNKITVKIFNNNTILEGRSNDENFGKNCVTKEFKIKENEDYLITIGRNQKCDIIIEDMMLSKIQAYMNFQILQYFII